MTILRLVGGSDVKPLLRRPEPPKEGRPPKTVQGSDSLNSEDQPLTETAKNGRLREQRKEAWRKAEAATRYWQARRYFESAVSIAQMRDKAGFILTSV